VNLGTVGPVISSRDNERFKSLKKLAASARARRKSGQALIEGLNVVTAYQEVYGAPLTLVISESAFAVPAPRRLFHAAPPGGRLVLSDALFSEVSLLKTPDGVSAIISLPVRCEPARVEYGVLLEDIQDPGNLGAILRSAAAAGVEIAYLSAHCADVWSPKALRAGMGAHFRLTLRERADLHQVADDFHGQLLAASLSAERSLFDLDLRGPVAFIVGNEGTGISPSLSALAAAVRIPMPGGMESLNAAAAAAVCLFERVRQRAAGSRRRSPPAA